ncbi:MAG TPA: EamA family transporter [Ilumatobacteraceae bacterium]|nr:EamA family transporter [Ilumatobacteraceae bacterium]
MPIALGALASILIGCSDFLGRYGTRRSNAVTATSGAMLGGAVTAVALLAIVPSVFAASDLALGAASGAIVGIALALLYEAMSVSSAAVAGPLVALGAALIPLGWDIARGNTPSGLVAVGVAIAIASLLLVMYSPALRGTLRRGVWLSLAAAVLFGVSFAMVGEAGADSGAWAPAGQRVVALGVMVALATARGVPRIPRPPLLGPMLVSGTCGSLAIVSFALGAQQGSLAAVAVSASMFPAVSATLAAAFDEDTLRWWQMVGILGVVGGIGLMAFG